jgi:NhaP-type Na+/H+ or K+/H+ antiporter
MSERTQRYLFALWTVVDEILNSVLFLLIGLETLILRFDAWTLLFATVAVATIDARHLRVPPNGGIEIGPVIQQFDPELEKLQE